MTLDEKIVGILAEDLGPSAKSFLTKQCQTCLNKDPASITHNDLDELAKSVHTGIKQILGDDIAEKIKQKILHIRN
ncbi:hypothetical protein ANME2D_01019 [Candidatus Methanoperedens nitroreducens]|uniref:Uncharacterized protein n=1 Tax=Candidatus Methanoperedens nitratireducens TaxID=1392998 RepID=A0A062VB96_9EURY|nr:hypothetical protein [Candidatus Methanoperedens nitroreducens]KCZ72590.1 hypothetical protein ANME2D_01019 [Candidatus Methanoperedens nitroreducens]MDJ1423478.1 hypothetical protein [Candidatus Methanoperedens sp.]